MRRIVFYSWQSDLPNATNRGMIQSALDNAAKNIAGDETVAIEPVIDRDTEGFAGSPDIASTIFAKIDAADIVVADVSIVHSTGARSAPNPNVMIEVGYALRALNFDRVLLVFNSDSGKIENLPFDLRMRRLVVYSSALTDSDRATARNDLTGKLERALRSALPLIQSSPTDLAVSPAVGAIEDQRPNRRVVVRSELAVLLKDLDDLQPKKFIDGGSSGGFLDAISNTQKIATRFSKLSEAVAIMSDEVIASEIYNWFGQILERCDLPAGFSGTFNEADFDVYRFAGHELFVTLFAFLLREQQWGVISDLLNEPISVRHLRRENGPGNAEWFDLSQHNRVLGEESHKRQRLSFHGDLLYERHQSGDLAGILSFEEFSDADFFLYLRGILSLDKVDGSIPWKSWSTVWLKGAPMFLLRAQSRTYADYLTKALALPSIEVLKTRLSERGARIGILYRNGFWDFPLRYSDIEKIGSR